MFHAMDMTIFVSIHAIKIVMILFLGMNFNFVNFVNFVKVDNQFWGLNSQGW